MTPPEARSEEGHNHIQIADFRAVKGRRLPRAEKTFLKEREKTLLILPQQRKGNSVSNLQPIEKSIQIIRAKHRIPRVHKEAQDYL